MLTKARLFALQAHGDQKYGDRPYSFHLEMVVSNLAAYGEQAQIAGYLHDVVEDTPISLTQIEAEFGALIAECVGLLTDAPGANRKERKAKTYAKLSRVSGPAELALIVKAADRLANVTACVADCNRHLWEVYRSEHPVFKQAAYRAGQCEALWSKLDTLLEDQALSGCA